MASLQERLERAQSGAPPTGAPVPVQTPAVNQSIEERLERAQSGWTPNPNPIRPTPTPTPTPAVSTAKDEDEEEDKGNFWDRVKGMFGNIFTKEEDAEQQPTTLQTTNKAESKDDEDVSKYVEDLSGKTTAATYDSREGVDDVDYGKLLVGVGRKGINQFAGTIASTADWLLGKPLAAAGWENNPFSWLNQEMKNEAQMLSEIYDENANQSVPAQLFNKYGPSVVATLPDALMAIYSGGASAALSGASKSGGIINTVRNAMTTLIKNPQFWTSFARTAGPSYEEAVSEGASDIEASAAAVLTALNSGIIEVGGGGIQELPNEVRNNGTPGILAWVKSTLDEGKEEVVQGIMTRAVQNLVYRGGPVVSLEDENAVFNPKTMAEDAAGGLIVGGLVSGGQLAVNSAINAGRANTQTPTAPTAPIDAPAAPAPTAQINAMPAQGEISPSDGVSAEPTTYTANAENVSRVDPGAPGFEATNVGGERKAESAKDDGLGAANAGFTINEGAQVPTQNKTVTQSLYMTDAEKQMLAPETHERISEAESINRAQQNFYTDSDGNIVNLDLTVEDLLNKDVWTAVEQDTAQIAMMELVRRARESGDYSKVQELGRKIETIGGTEVARSLQARQKWVGESGTNIMIAATKEVEALPEAERNEVLNEVAQLAGEFDEVLKGEVKPKRKKKDKQEMDYVDEVDTKLDAKREVEGLMELIRRTAKIRRTTGLFSKEMSRVQEWALKHVAERGDIEFLRSLAANGILSIASDKQSKTAGEWITTYRRQAMLSKASTIMRNLVSNGVFDIVDTLARDIVVPLDAALSKRTGTRSVAVDKYYFSKAKRQGTIDGLAKSFLEVGLDVDASGNLGRYESTSNRTAKMSGGVVSRLFSTWEKYGGYGLVTTDAAAKGGTEAEIQRGIDELYNKGLIKDDSLENAGESEAEYRTFQDDSRLSDAALDIRRDLDKPKWRIGGEKGVGIGTLAIPFAKTPTNLATRAVEYSPAGLIKGGIELGNILIKGQKGNFTAAEQARVVQEFGRGFTGSALIGLSVWGALSGVIKTIGNGSDDEDKDKTAYDKMSGQNGTQWNLSAFVRGLSGGSTEWQDDDVLMNISFLEPINSHLTAGALIAEDIRNDEASFANLAWDSVDGAMKSILDMPMMSAIKDAMQQSEYAEGDNISERAGNALLAYGANQISSFVPNAVKGIAQGIDPIQRNTYAGDNLWEQTLSNVMSGIPGLRSKVEAKTDSFGNEMRNEGGVLNFLNSNILPGYITHYNEQTGSALLDSVYELTGNASIYPDRKAPNSISGTDANGNGFKFSLDSEAGQKYLATAGAEHEAFLKAAENNAEFSKLSAEEQAAVLTALRSQAHAEAKYEAITDSGHKVELSEAEKLKASLPAGALVDYLIAKEKAVIPNNYTSNPTWQKFEMAAAMPESFALDMIIAQGGDTGRRIAAAVDSGVDLDKAIAYYRATTERNDKGENPSKAEENQRIAALGLTAEERGALIRAFNLEFD